jgi:hypothetical protein
MGLIVVEQKDAAAAEHVRILILSPKGGDQEPTSFLELDSDSPLRAWNCKSTSARSGLFSNPRYVAELDCRKKPPTSSSTTSTSTSSSSSSAVLSTSAASVPLVIPEEA